MLNAGLIAAFVVFCLVLALVLAVAIKERRAAHDLETGKDLPGSKETDEASDTRVALVIFGSIIIGALLAIIVGYLVFFSGLK
jgi:heme/copper-type cytochrome/quinol oxidase subunit 2